MSSITVVVPAFNEEGNLADTIREITPLLERQFQDYEILIVNDGSSDRTGPIADELAARNPRIRVVHNPKNMGLGYNYKKGVALAVKDYVIMIPGDNEITGDSFEGMFKLLGRKDIVIPHTTNMEIRPLGRRILSRAYTLGMNLLFGLNLRYYNGTVIHKRALIQSVPIETDGFAYQAEALIRLIKKGHTYLETGMTLKQRGAGRSKALRLSNIARVLKAIGRLFVQIRLGKS
jgi:glycosyltransferase involved in cell wall biosynthesis